MNINLTLIGQVIAFAFFCRILHEVCLATTNQCD